MKLNNNSIATPDGGPQVKPGIPEGWVAVGGGEAGYHCSSPGTGPLWSHPNKETHSQCPKSLLTKYSCQRPKQSVVFHPGHD